MAVTPGGDDVVMDHRHAFPEPTSDPTYTIDCDECSMQGTEACTDCVVTFLCAREPGDAIVVDLAEYRALEMLAESGLAPSLRHRRRLG